MVNIIFVLLVFLPINAFALKPTSESRLPYAYKKGKEHYDKVNWVEAYSYLKASQICYNHTIFKSGHKETSAFWNEIKSAMNYSWDKIHNNKVAGFSLTNPSLRNSPPE